MEIPRLALALLLAAGPASDFKSHHAAGEALLRQGKVAAAIPYLERARKADPGHYANSYDLAVAYLETGRVEEARALVERMLAARDVAELHNLLGDIEERGGRYVEAAREYQRAVRMEPSEKHVFDWGDQLLRHRAYDAALDIFRRGGEMHPKSARMRVGLAVAYHSRRQYEDAVKSLCEAIDLDPNDPRAIPFLGQMHDLSPEMAGEVARRLEHYARLYPTNAPAQYFYGLSLWKRADNERAELDAGRIESHLKAALAADPRMAEAHFQLGLLYERQKRETAAIAAFEQVVRLKPDFETAHYRLGLAYQRAGRAAEAQRELALYRKLHGRQQERSREAGAPALVVK